MNSFTHFSVKALRADLEAAIKQVAVKHNLVIGFEGAARFSPTELTFAKLTAVPNIPVAVTQTSASRPVGVAVQQGTDPYNTLESREYLNLGYTLALPKHWLGKKFKTPTGVYTLIGLKTSYRKYPIIGISARGTRYKFAVSTVKAGIIL